MMGKQDSGIFTDYPEMTAGDEERRAWVERVQHAAVKARSNIFESLGIGPAESAFYKDMDRYLLDADDPLNLVTVTDNMLEGGRIPSISDLINVNYIVGKSTLTQAVLLVRPTGG